MQPLITSVERLEFVSLSVHDISASYRYPTAYTNHTLYVLVKIGYMRPIFNR